MPTGHKDLWAGENVKVRNSEFPPETIIPLSMSVGIYYGVDPMYRSLIPRIVPHKVPYHFLNQVLKMIHRILQNRHVVVSRRMKNACNHDGVSLE
jgi:hypothetical protein